MNATVAFGAVVVSVIAFATAARSAEYDPGSPTYAAIAAAVKERVRVARPWTVNVSAATVEDDYAFVGWIAGDAGGQSILRRIGPPGNRRWTIVMSGGGSIISGNPKADASYISQTYHVPLAVARRLVDDLRNNRR